MINQALFSSKNKSKRLKCHLLQFLFGALRVNSCLLGKVKYCVNLSNLYKWTGKLPAAVTETSTDLRMTEEL